MIHRYRKGLPQSVYHLIPVSYTHLDVYKRQINTTPQTVAVEYKDQTVTVQYESTTIENTRQKADVSVVKKDSCLLYTSWIYPSLLRE